MNRVTVVIATRNRAGELLRTVARLRALPERPPVIVVDNGSTDGTPERVAHAFPDVRVLKPGRNLGAVARNLGVSAAATPYVAFADDDSWWADGALARAQELLDAHPRLALIAARALVGPGNRLDPMCAFMAVAPIDRAEDLPGPSVLGFLACATVVRREAYLSVGGFDPVVFFMGEEERLAYDLAAAGWGLAYCPEVVAHHHPQAAAGDRPGKRMLAARNRALTAWMRRPMRVALAETRPLLRGATADAAGRSALAQFVARLPAALRGRRAPDPTVEAALARLDAAQARHGYPPHPTVIGGAVGPGAGG
ncbi:glycosyltransferase family 2 protein [Planosporangium sp. 12N6]|uniref:glycosyltransferase family 2 protein n=1 Tax=Planosporangium spinosum TaxID=3402278 RepID=UPI003CE81DEC